MNRGNRQTAGIRLAAVLFLSLGLNLALAWAGLKLWREPVPPAVPAATEIVVLAMNQESTPADAGPRTNFVTNYFHWQQVSSTNYEEYVAKLRAIGCPEKTLRDIILPDVDRHFAKRRREAQVPLPFWTGGRQRQKAERLQAGHSRELEKEQEALIQHLLGINWFGVNPLRIDRFEDQAVARFFFGPMPEETFRKTVELANKSEALQKDLTSRADGILTDADEAALREMSARRKLELRTLLSANELQEMVARAGAMRLFFNGDLQTVLTLSPAEARQIALAWMGDITAIDILEFGRDEPSEETEPRERQFTNSVALLLGEKRFADFQRARDGNFVQLFNLAAENNLPPETAVAVYDMRQLTAHEVQNLRDDGSLDAAARQQKLDTMSDELQTAVSAVLGATAYQRYLQGNGAWITNLTRL